MMHGVALALALVYSRGDSVPSLQRQLAAHVNLNAHGQYEAPDPPMGGTHAQSFKLGLVRHGFNLAISEDSGGLSYVERATVKWSNIMRVREPKKDGLSSWNTTIELFEPVRITRSDRLFNWKEVWFESGLITIGFPAEDQARACTRLLRLIAGP